jgi:hypothetical protein
MKTDPKFFKQSSEKSQHVGKFEIEVEGVHPVVCEMNKISEMFIPSNTIYITLKFKLGYMFPPCGVIRPLQFDEAVRT